MNLYSILTRFPPVSHHFRYKFPEVPKLSVTISTTSFAQSLWKPGLSMHPGTAWRAMFGRWRLDSPGFHIVRRLRWRSTSTNPSFPQRNPFQLTSSPSVSKLDYYQKKKCGGEGRRVVVQAQVLRRRRSINCSKRLFSIFRHGGSQTILLGPLFLGNICLLCARYFGKAEGVL